jgi:hypothetical protein
MCGVALVKNAEFISKKIWIDDKNHNLAISSFFLDVSKYVGGGAVHGLTGACTVKLYGFVIYKKRSNFVASLCFSFVSHKYTSFDEHTSLLRNL